MSSLHMKRYVLYFSSSSDDDWSLRKTLLVPTRHSSGEDKKNFKIGIISVGAVFALERLMYTSL
jgi:hypothetical protein